MKPENSQLVREPDSTYNVVFTHSRLDDAGLSLAEHRVYVHLARRAGNGYAFPGLRSIALVCRCNVKTVATAINGLLARGMITRERRPNSTPLYRITPVSAWTQPTENAEGVALNGTPSEQGGVVKEATGVFRFRPQGVVKEATKGYPLKGTQLKEIHTPIVPQGDVNAALKQDQDVESLYSLYPRKIGKGSALKAIRKALKSTDAEVLREAVGAYAAAVGRWPKEELQFVPHPATWFNGRRWEDDRGEWERRPKPATKNGLPSPHIPEIRFA